MINSTGKLDKRDLRRLELFCEIVEQNGISNATHTTGLSQPVLSNQLIELEKSLGITLCKRGRSGFELTSEGHTVYRYANELSSVLSDFSFKLKGVQSTLTGHVRVGVLDNTVTLKNNPIPQAIENFYQLSNSVDITLEVGDHTFLSDKLSKNQLDMMVVVLGEHNVNHYAHVQPLFYEKSRLFARQDVADEIIKKGYSLSGQRINIGGYSARIMQEILRTEQYDDVKLIDGWNVESGVILTLAGTHLSFLPTHLIDNNHLQQQLVALKPDQWVFSSEFSLVLKTPKNTLTPAALAFYHCLADLSPYNAI
ncbi:LysR family transcriptional regulator [Marinomonas pollencensis]|uniref:DNA-binding transcriptional LysR family regulator n=1 Tax=Marinomonas pollencensis TaxID=491954 RepID=A0A3E0DKF3_9GAMM|nr:LysR family transcriptional regulator [Marinomonas pollencensis]REG83200.1 DNA-binding transcriptional LysR family regulator [Marinomonas pollencensis]